jgi:Skp family chaperone for outer membrane proteins
MICNQLWRKKWVAVSAVILLMGALTTAYLRWQSLFPANPDVALAKVDLESLLKEHPDWSEYLELQREMDQLREKWGDKSAPAREEPSDSNLQSSTINELKRQVREIERSYYDENQLKQDNLNKSIGEYVQNKTQQFDTLLGDKLKNINSRLSQDLQKKSRENENKYQSYVNTIQSENQAKLSNMQFQLAMLDMSQNQISAKSERERLQAEIKRIKDEMEQKKAVKFDLLQKDTEVYAENRKKEATAEFEQFKAENEQQFEAEIRDYHQTMEEEYLTWQKQREQEKNSAKKLREDQQLEEYRKDSARETIIRSQQAQLRERMIWEVRQKVKRIAQTRKIDCVLVGELVNLCIPDLTRDIKLALVK